ncbi:hypothetical protein SCARD494_06636 [Seiridium cardinale]
MATATSSTALPAVPDQAPQPSSTSPALVSSQHRATPNGSSAPVTEGVLHPGLRLDMRNANGAQRDGRVRNPIPSKLKGKTDEKKGNFNVMHMDISNSGESQARYDAAKRSSENTALQAKLAETDHYVSHHRRANYARAKSISDSATPAPPPPPVLRNRNLAPEDVKAEQARLLTLLRTLPHANIVDQICKALAFFGGIPDAPPPPDGKFPDSGEANGSGHLFVGWLSEIFPDLERPRRPALQLSAPPKRPRGRPKGSKATKARRDKGVKKGAKAVDGSPTAHALDQQDGDEDGWEDVNDSLVVADREADSVEDRVLSLLQTTHPSAVPLETPATGGSSAFTSINPASMDAASTTKKRGRPKGSKNRQREAGTQDAPHDQTELSVAPTTTATFQPPVAVDTTQSATATPSKRVTGGRAKGGKKKATNANATVDAVSGPQVPAPPIGTSTSYIPPPTLPLAATRPPITTAPGAINGSSSKTKRTQLPSQTQTSASTQFPPPAQPAPQVKESAITGAKRKRQNNKPAGKAVNAMGTEGSTGAVFDNNQAAPPLTPTLDPGNPSQNQSQANSMPTTNSIAAPPAKRPRKSTTTASKRKSTTAISGDVTSSAPSADSAPSQQPIPAKNTTKPNRPHVEGLEAHYEHFAALQSNNDQPQAYGNQPQQQLPATNVSTSSASAEGLEAHYERFQSLQNRQQSVPQTAPQNANPRQQSRQIHAQAVQPTSPAPPQLSKTPQMGTLPSQQQNNRPATNTPNYYAQSQTPAFVVQQGSYSASQRQSQNTSTSSPGTGLVSHVTHSPQYATQNSNSPLMSNDTTFRGSPSLGFASRRTPSASPMDNTYRTNNIANQSFANPRQTPATSHAGVPPGYSSFADNGFLDLQSFDSTNGNNMGLGGTGSYTIGSSNVQRNNSASNTGAAYANAAMTNGTYDQNGLNKGALNTAYRGQARWS